MGSNARSENRSARAGGAHPTRFRGSRHDVLLSDEIRCLPACLPAWMNGYVYVGNYVGM